MQYYGISPFSPRTRENEVFRCDLHQTCYTPFILILNSVSTQQKEGINEIFFYPVWNEGKSGYASILANNYSFMSLSPSNLSAPAHFAPPFDPLAPLARVLVN